MRVITDVQMIHPGVKAVKLASGIKKYDLCVEQCCLLNNSCNCPALSAPRGSQYRTMPAEKVFWFKADTRLGRSWQSGHVKNQRTWTTTSFAR